MSAALQLVDRPDTTDLSTEASVLVIEARSLEIVDDASYSRAVEFMNGCADLRKKITAKFTEPKRKAHEAHKSLCTWEAEELQPVDLAEREAKKKIATYRDEQERKRQEEERRLRDEARKREEERLLAEAFDAESDGDHAAAAEIISAPIATPPVHVAPATPKAAVSFREEWKFELVSILEVAKHVAAHPEDANLLQLNTVAVGQMVRARKSLFKVSGIRAYSSSTVAAGRR